MAGEGTDAEVQMARAHQELAEGTVLIVAGCSHRAVLDMVRCTEVARFCHSCVSCLPCLIR